MAYNTQTLVQMIESATVQTSEALALSPFDISQQDAHLKDPRVAEAHQRYYAAVGELILAERQPGGRQVAMEVLDALSRPTLQWLALSALITLRQGFEGR